MKKVMRQLLADKRISLGYLENCPDFQELLETDIPKIIDGYHNLQLTFKVLVKIHHCIAALLADKSISVQNERIVVSLSGCNNLSLFLAVWNMTEEEYCVERSFISPSDYLDMAQGLLTVDGLYQKNPTAFLSPLLRKRQ